MKKKIVAATLLSSTLLLAACGNDSGKTPAGYNEPTSQAQTPVSQPQTPTSQPETPTSQPQTPTNEPTEVTAAEKKAYVEEEYPDALKNDFRKALPFSDIMGAPLANVKNAVNTSPEWQEETSTWAEYETITGYIPTRKPAYVFSNRAFNMSGQADGILDYCIYGLVNLGSTKLERVQYIYVFTDDTMEQKVTNVAIADTNSGTTLDEVKNAFAKKYSGGFATDEGGEAFLGIISDIDYGAIYDYDHDSDIPPACLGYLRLRPTDYDVILMSILPYR